MSIPSTVEIIVGGTDLTNNVLPSSARFEGQMNAMPGSCEFVVRDREQVLSFVTGDEIEMKLDGADYWGGYVSSVTMGYFTIVDTANPAGVQVRKWTIRGVDFNCLFDKLVIRNEADYLHAIVDPTAGAFDGELIRYALTDALYYDIDPAFDVITDVDDITPPALPAVSSTWAWPEQGSKLRELLNDLRLFSGAVFYFAAGKKLFYKALEDVESRWGFSDAPNHAAITGAAGYQGATIGFREIEAVESGGPAGMVNDAFIWGGSEWSGSGGTVFAREENTTSITAHGRWQMAETHFGETGFKTQDGVDARADVIVNGGPVEELPVGAYDPGLKFPQWTITLLWNAFDVPRLAAVPQHLRAGDLVYIDLETFGDGSPLQKVLPLRSVTTTFVGVKEPSDPDYDPADDEIAFAQIRGTFGLQPNDPNTLWGFLLNLPTRTAQRVVAPATVDGSNPAPYGALFTGEPEPATDGVETVFELPDDRGYIVNTTELYHDGLLLRRGIDYTESDPENGEVTLTVAPTEWLWIVCRTT